MTVFLFLMLILLNQVQASNAEMETLLKKQSDNLVLCGTLSSLAFEMQDNVKQRDVLKIDYERLFYGKQICEISLEKCTVYRTVLDQINTALEPLFEEATKIKNLDSSIRLPSEFIIRLRSITGPSLAELRKIEDDRGEALKRQDYSGREEFVLETPSEPSTQYLINVRSINLTFLTWENIRESFETEKRESLRIKLLSTQKELAEDISHNQKILGKLELMANHKYSSLTELAKRYGELKEKMSQTLSELS